MKIFFHDIDREIIVNASVVGKHALHLYWLEYHRKRHRGTDSVRQRSAAAYYLVLIIDIAVDASERNEKPVEIASALHLIWREKIHELDVHRNRIDYISLVEVRLDKAHGILLDRGIDTDKLRSRPICGKVISQLGIYRAGAPVGESRRREQLHHFFRRIAAAVESAHNRAHRGASHIVDRDAVLLQSLYYAGMRDSLRASSAEHKPYFLGGSSLRHKRKQESQQKNSISSAHKH